ncbi:patatin-like phospholipase family protein [Neptuniibacter sp. QD37_11]|uniref:patatin-like phospholipase family protein n=1 Tax=Neptuniibacter sp. QD37_11 TaxID=3398209 RepID=UPI0039F5A128
MSLFFPKFIGVRKVNRLLDKLNDDINEYNKYEQTHNVTKELAGILAFSLDLQINVFAPSPATKQLMSAGNRFRNPYKPTVHLNDAQFNLNPIDPIVAQAIADDDVRLSEADKSRFVELMSELHLMCTEHPLPDNGEPVFNESRYRDALRLISFQLSQQSKNYKKIKNLCLSGGGAKGMAYPGVLEALEDADILEGIERVAGTSAGGISALPLALGYPPRVIRDIVLNKAFAQFLTQATPILRFGAHFSSRGRRLVGDQKFLNEFKKVTLKTFSKIAPDLSALPSQLRTDIKFELDLGNEKKAQRVLEQHVQSLSADGVIQLIDYFDKHVNIDFIVQELIRAAELEVDPSGQFPHMGFSNAGGQRNLDAIRNVCRLIRNEDIIEEFFGDLIEERLQQIHPESLYDLFVKNQFINQGEPITPTMLRNLTFPQLKALADQLPEFGFKELYICIAKEKDIISYEQIDVWHGNKEYQDMPIKTAVRISMNLPIVFKPYKYKDNKYVDGGVRANYPMHIFDRVLGHDLDESIGFIFSPEGNFSKSPKVEQILHHDSAAPEFDSSNMLEFIKDKAAHKAQSITSFFHMKKQQASAEISIKDYNRLGIINAQTVGTADFDLSTERRKDLMKQGGHAAEIIFSQDYDLRLHFLREKCLKDVKQLHKAVEKFGINCDMTLNKVEAARGEAETHLKADLSKYSVKKDDGGNSGLRYGSI